MYQVSAERALVGGFALGVGVVSLFYQWNKHTDRSSRSRKQEIINGQRTPPVTLIVIDMQKGFEDEKYWGGSVGSRSNPECEEKILKLLKKWRAKKWPIIHVRHLSGEEYSPLNPQTPLGSGYDWKKGFEPQEGEFTFIKNVNSAFIGTDLFQRLKKLDFPPIVVCGLTANHCVNTTARMAGNFGLKVFLPFDATAAFPRVSCLDNTKLISAQEIHEIALSNLHREFCHVTTVEKIISWIDSNTWPLVCLAEGDMFSSISTTSTSKTVPPTPSSLPPPSASSLLSLHDDEKSSPSSGPSASFSLLEHINLNVPDASIAESFYVNGLGFKLNPQNTNERQIHVNMGVSQLHLPYKLTIINKEPVTEPQLWKGRICLQTEENLNVVCERVLKNHAQSAVVFDSTASSHASLRVVCPWGNIYVLTQCSQSEKSALLGFKGHAGGSGSITGMPCAVHVCPPGSAKKIAQFYREILGVRSQVLNLAPIAGRSSGLFACKVVFRLTNGAPTQSLVFEENEIAPPFDLYDKSENASYHVCMYYHTQEDYEASLRRAAAANLLYVNPRFQGGPHEFSSAHSVEEGLSIGQYRVKDMCGGLVLEHEIRSPHHTAWPLGPAA